MRPFILASFIIRVFVILLSLFLLWKYSSSLKGMRKWKTQQKTRFCCAISCFISLSLNLYSAFVRVYRPPGLYENYLNGIDASFNFFIWLVFGCLALAVFDRYMNRNTTYNQKNTLTPITHIF